MKATLRGPAPRPCESCPYRRDVPSGVWSASEYDKLPGYDEPTPSQPARVFACHRHDGRVCAGWAGCHAGEHLLSLRLALLTGGMTVADYEATVAYSSPVPLFSSGAEAATHGKAEVEAPGAPARRVIAKVSARLAEHGGCVVMLGAFFKPDGTVDRQHLAAVPARSRFTAGDRVQMHGYSGAWPGMERYGFRGVVLGGYGGDLRGLTDDGREWVAGASALVRDGERETGGVSCVCCPHPERFRPRRPKRAPKGLEAFGPPPECLRPYLPAAPVEMVQLDLFEVAA